MWGLPEKPAACQINAKTSLFTGSKPSVLEDICIVVAVEVGWRNRGVSVKEN